MTHFKRSLAAIIGPRIRGLLRAGSALAVGGALALGVAQANPLISITPSAASVSVGDTFTVQVGISGVADLYGWQLDLDFNPSLVAADSAGPTEGGFLGTAGSTLFLPGVVDNLGGSVSFNGDTLIGAIPGASGAGALLTFGFTALAAGDSAFTLGNVTLLDSNLNSLQADTAGADVMVKGGITGVPEPPTLALCAVMLLLTPFLAARGRRLRWN